jgi:ferredoxin-type protein NapF
MQAQVDTVEFPIGKPLLDPSRCHAWNGVLWMSCIGRCDSKALRFDARRRVLLDSDSCNGCGACVAPCPAGALSLSSTAPGPC